MRENNLSKFHEIERQETEFIKVLESFKLPVFLLKKNPRQCVHCMCFWFWIVVGGVLSTETSWHIF